MPRRLIALFTARPARCSPAAARAGWIPAAPIDGPNADVVSVGNVDLARDGTGAVAYLRNDGGVPHAFVSRLFGGGWRAPERVDSRPAARSPRSRSRRATATGSRSPGSPTATSTRTSPRAAARAGRRSRPRVADRRAGRESTRHRPGRQRRRLRDLAAGRQRRAARLQDTTWTRVARPLDVDPDREAGTGALRPRVAVSAEGYAVVDLGRRSPDGCTRVWARRVTGMNALAVPAADLNARGRRQRRLARHRHRGRRLVRLGRLPPGRRRRLAHGRAAAGRLAVRGAGVHRRRRCRRTRRGST